MGRKTYAEIRSGRSKAELWAEVERALADGEGPSTIGARLDISPRTLYRWVKRPPPLGARLTERQKAVQDALRAGDKVTDIAARSGISARTLYRWRRRWGLPYLVEGYDGASLYERVMRRVEKVGDCLVWTGATRYWGYGHMGRYGSPHRIVWEHFNGPIPDDKEVCHSCDNPPCCYIGHLWLGTHRENVMDSVRKGRWTKNRIPLTAREFCKHGHRLADVGIYESLYQGRVWRRCRECIRERERRRRNRSKG